MAAATAQPPAPAHTLGLSALDRVASIPLVSDSLSALHATLSSSPYTRQPYSLAHTYAAALVSSPYVAATQTRLQPVLTRADGLAHYGLDAIERRVPYAFEADTQRVVGDLRKNREHAYGVAEKTIDERVRTPAVGIATGIDQRFTPVVDRFAHVVDSLHSKAPSSDSETPNGSGNGVNGHTSLDAYQYQRAYRLSLDLTETLLALSGAQIRQIQEHNGLVQRASETAHTLTHLLASSLHTLTSQIQALSTLMLADLSHLQSSLATLPAALQSTARNLSARLGPVIGDVRAVVGARDVPVQEKVGRLRRVLEEGVKPLLGEARAGLGGLGGGGAAKASSEKNANGAAPANGNGEAAHFEEPHQLPARV